MKGCFFINSNKKKGAHLNFLFTEGFLWAVTSVSLCLGPRDYLLNKLTPRGLGDANLWFYFALTSLAQGWAPVISSGITKGRVFAPGELPFGREDRQYTSSASNPRLITVRTQPLKGTGCCGVDVGSGKAEVQY